MLNRLILLLAFAVPALFSVEVFAQSERPRLVVVVSVDQLCQEYLQRFRSNLQAEKKFFALADEQGAIYRNCHHQHAFTVTAPGHAVLLTGTYPNVHGIVGNNWFDRSSGKTVYCVSDSSVENLGMADANDPDTSIGMSPRNLQAETVGDVLKLVSGGRSKVFGLAWKDRAGVLMAGHGADGVYWMQSGEWVTSTYYRDDVPGYIRNLNQAMHKPYSKREWKPLLPLGRYLSWTPDNNIHEKGPNGMTRDFPHILPDYLEDAFLLQLPVGPFANEITLQLAKEIIREEKLGQDAWPDLLCIGFSANDYVGHAYGPQSLEVEDMTYRIDALLADLVAYLTKQVGPSGWTIALSSDHGVAPIPKLAAELKLPAVRNPVGTAVALKAQLESHLRDQLELKDVKNPLIVSVDSGNIYLQHGHRDLLGEKFYLAQKIVRDYLLEYSAVVTATTRNDLMQGGEGKLMGMLQKACHPRRSGDILYVTAPYGVPGSSGTTHGSPWIYDSHVPLIFLGQGIRSGRHDKQCSPAAMAATLARLIGIDPPAAAMEQPLGEALR